MFRTFLLCCVAASGASLTISPPVIYSCSGIHGAATIAWAGASGPVQVQVGPARAVMTGIEPPAGRAVTGAWVADGLQFALVNLRGEVEAVATARVKCGGEAAAGSYFPLAAGNTWVYRYDSRSITSDYIVTRVAGTQWIDGREYYEIQSEARGKLTSTTLLREDGAGRVWQRSGASEQLYLDPGLYARRPYAFALGDFPDAVFQQGEIGLGTTDRTFVRGIGLVKSTSRLNTGSSGGFTDGLDLIEVRLAGGVHLELPGTSLTLSAERTVFDVTGRKVTNCAIPCYFTACGIAGADPPGTYKPCAQARVKASGAADFLTELELVNAGSQVVFRAPATDAPAGESVRYVQLPLYSAPNIPLPAGEYRLIGRLKSGGAETVSSTMTLRIE